MSNHVFDIFNSSSRNPTKVSSKIHNGGKRLFSNNNFEPVKPLEANRIKSSSGLNIRQPLADCRPNNKIKVSTAAVKPSPKKSKECVDELDRYKFKICNDDFEDILPKHKRINVDDIKNILNCFATPTPQVAANRKVNYPSIIEFDENVGRNDNYIFEDDNVFELTPPKNPFFDDD